MLFRQLWHRQSSTFSYLVASRIGGEALFVDPVRDQLDLYLRLIEALDVRLVFAIDTHAHEDHESALEDLLDHTQCVTAMGQESRAECVARHVSDGEIIDIDGVKLEAAHTPGHTDDSYSFVMDDRVFTGDTLLIRGTGRTDRGGDARQQYNSLFSKLLTLPGRTLVYPAHDYNGRHVSSIADERRHNPRLQVKSVDEYVALMENLRPEHPHQMDVVERPSWRASAALLRELSALRSLLTSTVRLPAVAARSAPSGRSPLGPPSSPSVPSVTIAPNVSAVPSQISSPTNRNAVG
jgi:glyoxylase-like metal-dependent hydrolase (beta-lactamase superfamily II)